MYTSASAWEYTYRLKDPTILHYAKSAIEIIFQFVVLVVDICFF